MPFRAASEPTVTSTVVTGKEARGVNFVTVPVSCVTEFVSVVTFAVSGVTMPVSALVTAAG